MCVFVVFRSGLWREVFKICSSVYMGGPGPAED